MLRKITTGNSVKYVAQSEQTRERVIKPNTLKNISIEKQKKLSQNKKILKDYITGKRFRILK